MLADSPKSGFEAGSVGTSGGVAALVINILNMKKIPYLLWLTYMYTDTDYGSIGICGTKSV